MAKFPDDILAKALDPLNSELQFKTLVQRYDDMGKAQRKQKWLYPRRRLNLQYRGLSKADLRTVWQFYIARKGSFGIFNLFLPWVDTYVGEYVGTADGTTTIYNLPSNQAASYTLYVGGAEQIPGGEDWTFTATGGEDGADKCEFVSAPAQGERITFDFSGILKIRCRFAEDTFNFQLFMNLWAAFGLPVQGELNDE